MLLAYQRCKHVMVFCLFYLKNVFSETDDNRILKLSISNSPIILPPTVVCETDEFLCDSANECYAISNRCDNYPDCVDGSDEKNCTIDEFTTSQTICSKSDFRCRNGVECISLWSVCDGHKDCADFSDELNCTSSNVVNSCMLNEFKCYDGSKCIALQDVCDGYNDCPDKSDENAKHCSKSVSQNLTTVTCHSHNATCMNGQCIDISQICDMKFDCTDGSDEAYCLNRKDCEVHEFKCRNNDCVLKTWLCDGANDCGDNSDEEHCQTQLLNATCLQNSFQCNNGQCIPKSFHCDNVNDCSDGSDEVGCTTPVMVTPPPAFIKLKPGEIFNISCSGTGLPIPLIKWRFNMGPIPSKCKTTSENGYGVLTCENTSVTDSGKYFCVIFNNLGSHIVKSYTTLIVGKESTCAVGFFNAEARSPNECIRCFCFGVSNKCTSAKIYTHEESLTSFGHSSSFYGVTFPDLKLSKYDNVAVMNLGTGGIQLRNLIITDTAQHAYYPLPNNFLGNKLESYNGSIRYHIDYTGSGPEIRTPDILISGNNEILKYFSNDFHLKRSKFVDVRLAPGFWSLNNGSPASREQIMLVLANIENILIKLQYLDGIQNQMNLFNVTMVVAGIHNTRSISESLVEKCYCPMGYLGLSCENCAPGFVREKTGFWFGRCIHRPPEQNCRPGYYGDLKRNISCEPCTCPLRNGVNLITSKCHLGVDDKIICRCPTGYVGRRCEQCANGYVGNPLVPGGRCVPKSNIVQCDKRGTISQNYGKCFCKINVFGEKCDQCKSNTFFLNEKSPTGCTDCLCMGVSRNCSSSIYSRHNVKIYFPHQQNEMLYRTTRDSNTRIYYNNFVRVSSLKLDNTTFYWKMPSRFLGNKITSYGGKLTFTIRYTVFSKRLTFNKYPTVIIKSFNNITLSYHHRINIRPDVFQTIVVPMTESLYKINQTTRTNRKQFLIALANVEHIFIKSVYSSHTNGTFLKMVKMDTASKSSGTNLHRAFEIEQCLCPSGYYGLSCENCSPGYKRNMIGTFLGHCEPCECNGHSNQCDSNSGVCTNCKHNTYGDHCEKCNLNFVGNATKGIYGCMPVIRSQPVITPQREVYFFPQNSTIDIYCDVTGNPYPDIEWRMNWKDLPTNVEQQGHTLHISNAKLSNSGMYVCGASNVLGDAEIHFYIEIYEEEVIKMEIYPNGPQKIHIGQSITLSCNVLRKNNVISTWDRSDGKSFSNRFSLESPGKLILTNALFEDSGIFECRTSGLLEDVILTTSIDIMISPKVTIVSDNNIQRLNERDDLVLSCSAEGLPRPLIQWVGPGLKNLSTIEYVIGNRVAYSVIFLYNVTIADAGIYRCISQNDAGSASEYLDIEITQPVDKNLLV